MYHSTSNAQKSPVMQARLEDCTGVVQTILSLLMMLEMSLTCSQNIEIAPLLPGWRSLYLLPAGQVTCNA